MTTNGHRLGTLCVVGQKALRFTAEQANMLAGMAELVVRHRNSTRIGKEHGVYGLGYELVLAWFF